MKKRILMHWYYRWGVLMSYLMYHWGYLYKYYNKWMLKSLDYDEHRTFWEEPKETNNA